MEFKISSETIGIISEALAKAQGIMGKAIKDSLNPHFKSKYADLASIMEASQKPLSENNLAFSSSICHVNGVNFLVGTLSHVSGEWLRTYIPLVLSKNDMQGLGACISYARRFALSSLAGIAVSDDDGESIVDHQETKQPTPQLKASDAQLKYLRSLISPAQEEAILAFYKMKDLSEMNCSQAKTCIDNAKEKNKNG